MTWFFLYVYRPIGVGSGIGETHYAAQFDVVNGELCWRHYGPAPRPLRACYEIQ